MIRLDDTETFCRACGCTEDEACVVGLGSDGKPIGCSWVLLDVRAPTGICSACAVKLRWSSRAMGAIGTSDEHLLAEDELAEAYDERPRLLVAS